MKIDRTATLSGGLLDKHLPDNSGDVRIQRAISLLKKSIHRPLSVGDIAQSVLLSKSHFAYLFRRETASSPARLLKRLRLLAAQRMLEVSDLSVKEIAARVGLNDVSHFVRDFQSSFGLSPTRYRKMLQASNSSQLRSPPATSGQASDLPGSL